MIHEMAKPFRPLKLVQNHRTLLGQLKEVQMYLIQRPIWYQTVLNSSHFYNLHVLGFIRASSSRKLSRWRTPQFSPNASVSPAHFFQFQPIFSSSTPCFAFTHVHGIISRLSLKVGRLEMLKVSPCLLLFLHCESASARMLDPFKYIPRLTSAQNWSLDKEFS